MPREILTPPQSGLFGKLPATGDFVTRGLPEGFRRSWDAWITRHLAHPPGNGVSLPEDGLRFRLVSGGRVAAGVILGSRDSTGRVFPLSLVLIADTLPGPAELDAWLDPAALRGREAIAGLRDADWLWQRLEEIATPKPVPSDGSERPDTDGASPPAPVQSSMTLWGASAGPFPADPDAPTETLDRLLPPSSG